MYSTLIIALFCTSPVFSENFYDLPFNIDLEAIKSPWEDLNFSEIIQKLSELNSDHETVPTEKIINGESAVLGQFPFEVFMLIEDSKNKTLFCGGSLIKRNWILTAAHCLQNKEKALIAAGIVDIKNGIPAWSTSVNKSDFFIHPEFDRHNNRFYDIALIKLPDNIPCHKNVGIIDLPCYCDERHDLDGMEVTVSGFGREQGNAPGLNWILRFVTLEVMPNCECKRLFPIPISNSQICTSTESGKSPCFGDSGSGLVANINGQNVVVGVVSFGNKRCATGKRYPAVFTRVSSYMNWIEQTISKNSLTLKF